MPRTKEMIWLSESVALALPATSRACCRGARH